MSPRRPLLAALMALAASFGARADIVSPQDGGPYPQAYRDILMRDKGVFALKRGWIARRALQRAGDPRYRAVVPSAAAPLLSAGTSLGGSFRIPVVLGAYADIPSPFVSAGALDRELFTGPWTPGTLTQYWREVSFGLLEVCGDVFDWAALAENEVYYTGGSGAFGVVPGVSRTGEMIGEILDARDAEVDFGAFDNDGPDGVPNSGDDDGYVDVLLVIHPTIGAECGYAPHMWSHSATYSYWPESNGQPYRTNDQAAGGGTILIDDYIIAPALSCATSTYNPVMIEIGVICHEIGHAIGLPDLYDYNGGGSGTGFWSLMGSGNWNTPASPAHPDAWCREQLGWLNPIEIDWRERSVSLRPVETHAEAVRIPLPTRRFRHSDGGAGDGSISCGYTFSEALARGWPNDEGYGNGWRESMIREFSVDASRPVTLAYDMSIDAESDFDFGMIILERDGFADTLERYTGRFARGETIDLGSHLPAGACSFTLRFLFTSDVGYSDEDGVYDCLDGRCFSFDDVLVSGGGLDYAADFEIDAGGWRYGGESAEYFIIENRRRVGFDANLRGQGMIIWHAENSIAYTRLGNSGGWSNTQARGLVLEEADGLYNLLSGGNSGDAGDPFPGSADNRSFGPLTYPYSHSNSRLPTPVSVSDISLELAADNLFNLPAIMLDWTSVVRATFVGGMFAPEITGVFPDTLDKLDATEAVLDIRGANVPYGASCALAMGADTIEAGEVDWLGENRVLATFALSDLYAGEWDVVVESGDGRIASLSDGVSVVSVYLGASVVEGEDDMLVSWTLMAIDGILGCLLYRSDDGGAFALVAPDTLRGDGGEFAYRDTLVEPGVDYAYRIVACLSGGAEEPYALAGPYRLESEPVAGSGLSIANYPNPFSGETTIRFFVTAAGWVEIDVYDVSGARVDRLASRAYDSGEYELPWKPGERGIAAGVYFCVLRSGGASRTVKMVYVP